MCKDVQGSKTLRCEQIDPCFNLRTRKVLITIYAIFRYDRLATRACISAMPNFRWCLNPECESGQIHEPCSNVSMCKCASCGFKTCVRHNQRWHEGETCDEFEYRTRVLRQHRVQESKSKIIIEKTTKKCPQCKANIEKNGGCDHMSCKSC